MRTRAQGILIRFTLREFLAQRVLVVLFILYLVFLLSLPLWKHFSPETEAGFLADFALGLFGFFLLLVTLLLTSDLLPGDLEKGRTVFFCSHPLGKWDYLLGRALGTWLFLGLTAFLLALALKGFFLYEQWPFSLKPVPFVFLKYLVLSSFLILISLIVERFSCIFFGLSFFLISNSLGTLSFFAQESGNPVLRGWMKLAAVLLPHFELFDLGSQPALGGASLLAVYFSKAALYAFGFTGIYFLLAFLILRRRTL